MSGMALSADAKKVADYLAQQKAINTSGPNLLITASSRFGRAQVSVVSCPGPVIRFAKGFVSYPTTWWSTHIHIAMLMGLFGDRQRMVAQMRQNVLGAILHQTRQNKEKTLQVAKFIAESKLASDKSGLAGRLLGGIFTTHATTRLPGQKKSQLSGGQKVSVGMANFIISSYGAAIYAIAKGTRRFEEILTMILVGDYNATLCIDFGKFDFSASGQIKYDEKEHKLIFDLFDGVDALNQRHRNYLTPINEFKR